MITEDLHYMGLNFLIEQKELDKKRLEVDTMTEEVIRRREEVTETNKCIKRIGRND